MNRVAAFFTMFLFAAQVAVAGPDTPSDLIPAPANAQQIEASVAADLANFLQEQDAEEVAADIDTAAALAEITAPQPYVMLSDLGFRMQSGTGQPLAGQPLMTFNGTAYYITR